MKLKNIISEQVDNLFCCEGVLKWQEMSILGEPINHNKSYVLVIGFGKPFIKIHGDMCPSHIWNLSRAQSCHSNSVEQHGSLTNVS